MSDEENINDVLGELFGEIDGGLIRPSSVGIAQNRIISLIQDARIEAVGWASVDGCKGNKLCEDANKKDMVDMLLRVKKDFNHKDNIGKLIGDAKRNRHESDKMWKTCEAIRQFGEVAKNLNLDL